MSQNAGRSTFKLGLYPFKYRDFLGIMAQKLNNFSQQTQKMFQVYLWSKNCQKFEFQELDSKIRVNMMWIDYMGLNADKNHILYLKSV